MTQYQFRHLRAEDFERAAKALECDEAAVRAVTQIESSGEGFLDDGRPRILYEGHIFSRLTKRRFDASNPTISHRSWTRSHYARGANSEIRARGEWARMARAISLDREAALQAASWGMFQIMGFNYELCGFDSVQRFVNAMYSGAGEHLDAFVMFVAARGLDDALRERDWRRFARGYNGPAYAANDYDVRLAAAYATHGGTSVA